MCLVEIVHKCSWLNLSLCSKIEKFKSDYNNATADLN